MFAARKTDGAVAAANYIEECFSVYLYTGNGSTQTITNGIDLAGKGGLVWRKSRTQPSTAGFFHKLMDTARGTSSVLFSNTTDAVTTVAELSSFNSNGFTMNGGSGYANQSGDTYVSWTFREQAKFFDVVTYTGNGANRTIAHNLGSVPGCIIVKRTDTTADWQVYHRSIANTEYLVLNSTAAKATGTTRWNSTTPTSTEFSLGTDSTVNANSGTYVAYLFAHDAGGFGATGTDNVITCGSYTGNASTAGPVVTLGYEPQWILIKGTTAATQQWFIFDTMRGIVTESAISAGEDPYLLANTSAAETSSGLSWLSVTSTGFQITSGNSNLNGNGENYIYIAIRRGPMKTPTSGTSVFSPQTASGVQSPNVVTDAVLFGVRAGAAYSPALYSRLQGGNPYFVTSSTAAEAIGGSIGFDTNNGIKYSLPADWVTYYYRRAPGFFDVVCYTGTGSNTTFTHNLSVVPEMMIVKRRDAAGGWRVYVTAVGNTGGLRLNTTDSTITSSTFWNNTTPTASVFTVGTNADVNASGGTYVAYLFASVTGVSKVGSYTGNGSNQTINCGFTAGARFILIKRYDSTGDWYVWDTARGIVSGNDPYLFLNSTAAEVTTDDSIDPDNSGFIVNQLSATNINVSSATYIYLAIA